MNRQDIITEIAGWILSYTSDRGFVHELNSEYVTRPITGGRQAFGIAVWDYSSYYELTILIEVRIDEVEQILHSFLQTPLQLQTLSHTIVTPLNYFTGGQCRVRVLTPDDLAKVTQEWVGAMQREILPYLDSAIDLVAIDILVNRTNEILNITSPPTSMMSHVIIAKLAKNPEWEQLIVKLRDELVDMGYPTSEYDQLVNHVSQYP